MLFVIIRFAVLSSYVFVIVYCCFFFFKQKTAYEMRISDWSSDVCSSDLMLTAVCLLFMVALSLSMLSLVMLFVPWEFLSESMRATWSLLTVQPPPWAQFALHAVVWVATSAIEPFYVGAGLGLYLNRRTRIEAWDVEIALRRMRTRLATTATALLLAIGAVEIGRAHV